MQSRHLRTQASHILLVHLEAEYVYREIMEDSIGATWANTENLDGNILLYPHGVQPHGIKKPFWL